jgi:foldase protein PrsA
VKKGRLFILTLLLLIVVMTFGGCKNNKHEVLVTINDKKLTLEDFLYDIYLIETEGNAMEEYYQNTLGSSYWDLEKDGITVRDAAKDAVFSRVIMYEILVDQAKKAGISLTENEMAENEAAVDAYIAGTTDTALVDSGLTRDLMLEGYNRISLGDKYYLNLAEGFAVDEEAIRESISPEEYREYKTECLYAPTVRSENQQLMQLTESELSKMQASIQKAAEQIAAGASLQSIAEDTNLTIYKRNFIAGDRIPEQEYREAAMALEVGEYSDIIVTSYGYYIIHMLDNASEDRYKQAIEDAIAAEEKSQFEKLYEELKKDYKITFNTKACEAITIGSVTRKEKD